MNRRAILATLTGLTLVVIALVPGPGWGDATHEHRAPTADPLRFDMTQFLTGEKGMTPLAPTAAAATVIDAPESSPVQSEPVKFVTKAGSNYSKRFLGKLTLFVQFDAPPVGINGTGQPGFGVALGKNGEELTFSQFTPSDPIAQNGTAPSKFEIGILGFDLPWKAGDTIEIWVYYYGLNKAENPTVHYLVGNGTYNSSLWMPMQYASIDELGHKHGNAKHFLYSEFDPFDLKRPWPGAEPVGNDSIIINVRTFHYAFTPDPIIVKNGTHVYLRFYYDPALDDFTSDSAEGLPPAPTKTDPDDRGSLHSWSTSYDPALTTRIYAGEVVVVDFMADRPGTYPTACTVYCGKSHYNMQGGLTILGENGTTDEDGPEIDGCEGPDCVAKPTPTPGFEALSVLFAAAVIVFARRRKAI
ncbi:MAG: hypothetical protein HY556_01590 [Euryarchaeota archaeon]|nr:hypothetical protein [Euryarchaeota archaeon]